MPDILFTDLAHELNINSFQLAKLRDEKLKPEEHFLKEGRKYFTEAGAEKMRLAVAIPLAVPKKVRGRVIHGAPNPRWVYAKLDGLEGKHPVAIPRRLYGRLVGKTINVDIIVDAQGGTSYRHEALGV